MTSIGVLTVFDHNTQDWSSYKSRLLQWYIANNISDENDKAKVRRRAILLSALSETTHKLASDLALPIQLEHVEFEEILKLLNTHFTPKRFGFAEKSAFYSAAQRPGETHTQWAARIRGLAAHCNFKHLEEALLDKFIMGMVPGQECDRLFVQEQAELTLAKALDMAESVRCARQAASTSAATAAVSAVSSAHRPTMDAVFSIGDKNEKCSVCGFTNHKSNQCRFKNYKCKKCQRKGHLRKMCSFNDKVKYIEESVDDGDDGQPMFNFQSTSSHPIKKTPMHQERGFLRVQPNINAVAFVIVHNFGLTTVEEGTYSNEKKEINLTSMSVSRMSFAKQPHVKSLTRTLRLVESDKLEMVVCMETESTALTEHLRAVYTREE